MCRQVISIQNQNSFTVIPKKKKKKKKNEEEAEEKKIREECVKVENSGKH